LPLLQNLLDNPQTPLFEQIVATLPSRLVSAVEKNHVQSEGHPGKRLGYMGFVQQIIVKLESIATSVPDGIVAQNLKSCERWELCQKEAEQYHTTHAMQIGGAKYVHSMYCNE